MFDNLFGSVTRFLQRLGGAAPAQRATTPQGQAKFDSNLAKKGTQGMQGTTPAGQAKLEAQKQAGMGGGMPTGKPVGVFTDKPMPYGKIPQKY